MNLMLGAESGEAVRCSAWLGVGFMALVLVGLWVVWKSRRWTTQQNLWAAYSIMAVTMAIQASRACLYWHDLKSEREARRQQSNPQPQQSQSPTATNGSRGVQQKDSPYAAPARPSGLAHQEAQWRRWPAPRVAATDFSREATEGAKSRASGFAAPQALVRWPYAFATTPNRYSAKPKFGLARGGLA